MLVTRSAVLTLELVELVKVPPCFQPEIPNQGGVSDDIEGRELDKSGFQGIMERTINPDLRTFSSKEAD